MDGKHVQLKCLLNSGSYYFNYNLSFIIVLLALVDADNKFLYVDVECNGRISDGGVFRNSTLCNALSLNTLNIPLSDNESLPYVVVADGAFPLKTYMMKAYASKNLCTEKRVFNYHLSRARGVVENAFSILANRFGIFLTPIAVVPETAVKLVLASCVLHNVSRTESPHRYIPTGTCDIESMENGQIRPGEWRNEKNIFEPLEQQGGNRCSNAAIEVRENYREHFNTVSRVPWIDKVV